MIEHDGRCGDGQSDDCPICRGGMSGAFVAMIEQAAAQPGQVMTADEFTAWLDAQAASSR